MNIDPTFSEGHTNIYMKHLQTVLPKETCNLNIYMYTFISFTFNVYFSNHYVILLWKNLYEQLDFIDRSASENFKGNKDSYIVILYNL